MGTGFVKRPLSVRAPEFGDDAQSPAEIHPMRKLVVGIAIVVLAGLALSGCGGSPQSAASRGDKAFQSAPAEIKSSWETAKKAIQANDYAVALTSLQNLTTNQGLSADQTHALQETATAVSDQMYAAANKGDPKAKEALDQLRKQNGH